MSSHSVEQTHSASGPETETLAGESATNSAEVPCPTSDANQSGLSDRSKSPASCGSQNRPEAQGHPESQESSSGSHYSDVSVPRSTDESTTATGRPGVAGYVNCRDNPFAAFTANSGETVFVGRDDSVTEESLEAMLRSLQ